MHTGVLKRVIMLNHEFFMVGKASLSVVICLESLRTFMPLTHR